MGDVLITHGEESIHCCVSCHGYILAPRQKAEGEEGVVEFSEFAEGLRSFDLTV